MVWRKLVGQLALRDRAFATKCQRLGRAEGLETMVDLGVDPADEEAGDTGNLRQICARLLGVLLETAMYASITSW